MLIPFEADRTTDPFVSEVLPRKGEAYRSPTRTTVSRVSPPLIPCCSSKLKLSMSLSTASISNAGWPTSPPCRFGVQARAIQVGQPAVYVPGIAFHQTVAGSRTLDRLVSDFMANPDHRASPSQSESCFSHSIRTFQDILSTSVCRNSTAYMPESATRHSA